VILWHAQTSYELRVLAARPCDYDHAARPQAHWQAAASERGDCLKADKPQVNDLQIYLRLLKKQKAMRHRDIRTTMIYGDVVDGGIS